MRTALVFLIALTAEAFAHGGGGFRGPSGGIPPGLMPSLACDCARIDCAKCSANDLAAGSGLAARAVRVDRLQRWNDFAVVRCIASFTGKKDARPLEAYAALAPAALFAPLGGHIVERGQTLTGARVDSREARRKYLWAKRNGLDPFLLLRVGPGSYALRAFPVRDGKETVVTIEGVALAPPRARGPARVYRTADLAVVVRDLAAGEAPKEGEFHDVAGRRALRFVVASEAPGLDGVVDVAFVPELRRAVEGDDTVMVALPPNAAMPPEAGASREPVDPPPPPPPHEPQDPPPPAESVAPAPAAAAATPAAPASP